MLDPFSLRNITRFDRLYQMRQQGGAWREAYTDAYIHMHAHTDNVHFVLSQLTGPLDTLARSAGISGELLGSDS